MVLDWLHCPAEKRGQLVLNEGNQTIRPHYFYYGGQEN